MNKKSKAKPFNRHLDSFIPRCQDCFVKNTEISKLTKKLDIARAVAKVTADGLRDEVAELRKAICIYTREISDYDLECEEPDNRAIRLFIEQMNQYN